MPQGKCLLYYLQYTVSCTIPYNLKNFFHTELCEILNKSFKRHSPETFQCYVLTLCKYT